MGLKGVCFLTCGLGHEAKTTKPDDLPDDLLAQSQSEKGGGRGGANQRTDWVTKNRTMPPGGLSPVIHIISDPSTQK